VSPAGALSDRRFGRLRTQSGACTQGVVHFDDVVE